MPGSRYDFEYRLLGDVVKAPAAALGYARKLLGYLAGQRRLGAAKTQMIERTMRDGTVVRAEFVGDQAQVTVTPAGAERQSVCELYVESGLLDLGTNIAADANARFNRGHPEFQDTPATLYFGDGMTCATAGGLNGRVQALTRSGGVTLRSTCLGEAGSAPQPSRLSSPAKKQAQAVLPASCWTGLMQRYVAALYGGVNIDYRLDGDALKILDTSVAIGSVSWGLVADGNKFAFVKIDAETATFYAPKFSPCGASVFEFWKKLPKSSSGARDRANKVLTIALSECAISADVVGTATLSFSGSPLGGYGWAFSPTEPKATVVTLDGPTSKRYEATFATGSDDGWSASVVEMESAAMPSSRMVPRPEMVSRTGGRTSLATGATAFEADVDAPIRAWFSDEGDLEQVRFSALKQDLHILPDNYICYGGAHPTFSDMGDTPAPCVGKYTFAATRPSTVVLAAGFYSIEQGWSTVEAYTTMQEQEKFLMSPRSFEPTPQTFYVEALTGDPVSDTVGPCDVGPGIYGNGGTIHGLYQGSELYGTPPCTTTLVANGTQELIATAPDDYEINCPAGMTLDAVEYQSGTCFHEYLYHWVPALSAIGIRYDAPKHSFVEFDGHARRGAGMMYRLDGMDGQLVFGVMRGAPNEVITTQLSCALTLKLFCHTGLSFGESSMGLSFTSSGYASSASQGVFIPCDSETFSPGLNCATITDPTCTSTTLNGVFGQEYVRIGAVGVDTHFDNPLTSDDYAIDPESITAPRDFSASPCKSLLGPFSHPIQTAPGLALDKSYASGPTKLYLRYVSENHENYPIYSVDFRYRALGGFLGAEVAPILDETLFFGAQIEMDTETISGGYGKVRWPSFVGWA